ncbi:MAG: ribose 5-phosphate isomerase A [Planctomycetes bacterium GWF2_41_51]|nr:MAG: ribose 5-phosphate isomerase A [Planctomycetes bacterium GWF2_41_51]HBG25522.1 ribose 5-phosphate isomerase A [Phycisphaerales bacterium]
MDISQAKRAAAVSAVKLVENHSIIGLGSGSTMEFFTQELVARIKETNDDIKAVATSYEAQFLAYKYNIPLLNLQNVDKLAMTVDGADEVDKNGDLIKGKGGAQLLEKIIASLSQRFIIIADHTKIVDSLGKNSPVPIEVLPPAIRLVQQKLGSLGCTISIRTGSGKVGPVITDLGNLIIDAKFDEIKDAHKLDSDLNNIPGVAGHGLFVNMARQVIIGFIQDAAIKVKTIDFRND